MLRYHALGSASTLVLCGALSAIPSVADAQTAPQSLPPVIVEAPSPRQAVRAAKKPPQRTAATSRRKKPVVTAAAKPAVGQSAQDSANGSLGTPPIKQRFQLPQESFSITSKQIDETINLKDPEDAVKYLPSLFVRKRNDGDNQAVLATRSWGLGSSARTLIYYDDLLVSALIGNNNSGASPHWNLISPESIGRIDFLNGPYSAAYPGNSIGGVLLITSKMPDKPFAVVKETVSVMPWDQYGTKDTYVTSQTSAAAGDRKGPVSFLVSANYLNSYQQPLTYTTFGTSITPLGVGPPTTIGAIGALSRTGSVANVIGTGALAHSEQTSGNFKVAYDVTPLVQATYSFGIWNNIQTSNPQTYLTSTITGQPTLGGQSTFASNKYTWDQTQMSNAVSLKSDTKGVYDFDLSISSYNYLQDILLNPFTVAPSGPGYSLNGKITRNDGTNWQNGDAKGIWRPFGYDGPQEISFGFHGDRYQLENPVFQSTVWTTTSTTGTGQLYSDSLGETRTGAAWAQDAWKILPNVKLTLGGRLESWQALNGFNLNTTANATTGVINPPPAAINQPGLNSTNFSPKASLSYDPNKEWNITTNFGEAYRYPTVTELYQNITVGGIATFANPSLTPEQDINGELNIERKWNDGRARLTLFEERVNNAIISQTTNVANPVTGAQTPTTTIGNVQAIRLQGVELSGEKNNVGITGLKLFGSVTYVDSRILSDPTFVSTIGGTTAVGKEVPNVPEWRSTFGVTYRPNDNWAYTVAARYTGKQFATLDNTDTTQHVYQAFDPFLVVDMKIHYNATQNFSFDFGIDNIFNEQYFLFHPFPGRTFVLAAKYSL